MRSIPDFCEYRGGRAGHLEQCNTGAKFVCPDGEVRTLLLYRNGLFIGPCHWHSVGRYGSRGPSILDEQAQANWPEFFTNRDGYVPYEPTVEEVKLKQSLERRFRWALTDTAPSRQGGLMRQDGSAARDVDGLGYIPVPRRRSG